MSEELKENSLESLDFIRRARLVHGDKYLYDKTTYKKCSEKVCITCPKHGDFLQLPCNHLNGGGCRKCAYLNRWHNRDLGLLKERKPVGITGRLWREVSKEERDGFRKMADEGFSMRDIGKKYGRDHGVVSYALKDEHELVLLRKKMHHERWMAKKRKPSEQVRLRMKLNGCIQQARSRAERKNIPINIDIRFLLELFDKQRGLCALTGIVMETSNSPEQRTNKYAVSLDRINSKLGYTRDNVRLVVWCINWMIGEWGEGFYEEISKKYFFKKYGINVESLSV